MRKGSKYTSCNECDQSFEGTEVPVHQFNRVRCPGSPLQFTLDITKTVINLHPSITIDRVVQLCENHTRALEDPGLCVHCGVEASNVEPDARGYRCESCGAPGVYGIEEILIQIA